MIPFAAVLLAGGRSRRMGRDKAMLSLPDGTLLWQRQLRVLRALHPAEIFVSGPKREGFPPELKCLEDDIPDLGPLAGIAGALNASRCPRLLVLAVDLPLMESRFLQNLLALAHDDESSTVVPYHSETGFYEPLAAVYSSDCQALAQQHLRVRNLTLQNFVRSLPVLRPRYIAPDEEAMFRNWNEPADQPASFIA